MKMISEKFSECPYCGFRGARLHCWNYTEDSFDGSIWKDEYTHQCIQCEKLYIYWEVVREDLAVVSYGSHK